MPGRFRRFEAGLVLASLAGAVVLTLAVMVSPRSTGGPSAVGPSELALPAGVRVEVRGNGPSAQQVADRLSASGATIGSVRATGTEIDSNSAEAATAIVYYDRRDAATAAAIRQMLGRGSIRREQVFEPTVDVTIVLGKDLHQA